MPSNNCLVLILWIKKYFEGGICLLGYVMEVTKGIGSILWSDDTLGCHFSHLGFNFLSCFDRYPASSMLY